ncbi:MAG: MBL fold metallo-hydrolase [Acidobacteria bacterium]|nr:MBL fold metallo-hydrolase [Acidobacteriota bacterium]
MNAPAKLIHEILPVGWLACNCSIVGDPETREALVIDPGDDADEILQVLCRHNLQAKYIVVTHAHIDHVGGLARLKEATGAPVLMHPDDHWLYRNVEMQAALIGMPAPRLTAVDQPLRAGDQLCWGKNLCAHVLHTPGHTPGSLSLYLPDPEKMLFAGDTLFAGSIGRTDLWGGSYEAILRSIHSQLLGLEDATRVYPGHGPSTTIGEERRRNPFLQGL